MKKIICIFCIAFSSISFAQSLIVNLNTYDIHDDYVENIYIKDIDGIFNPYIGTWQWTDGNKTLIITFYKASRKFISFGKFKYYCDKLYANYKYIESGTTVVNTFNSVKPTIRILGLRPRSATKAAFAFTDVLKNKTGDIKTELITNLGTPQLKFVLKNTSGGKIIFPGEPDFDWSFSIPTDIVLTKVQ